MPIILPNKFVYISYAGASQMNMRHINGEWPGHSMVTIFVRVSPFIALLPLNIHCSSVLWIQESYFVTFSCLVVHGFFMARKLAATRAKCSHLSFWLGRPPFIQRFNPCKFPFDSGACLFKALSPTLQDLLGKVLSLKSLNCAWNVVKPVQLKQYAAIAQCVFIAHA